MNKKVRKYSEAEIITVFGLEKVKKHNPAIDMWLSSEITFNEVEQSVFDDIFQLAADNIEGWSEEDLKMNFISFVLRLGHLFPDKQIRTFFDKTIEATVDGHFLRIKTDFMVAKGVLDLPQKPYFHFQEYKRQIDPTGNPMAQLLEAMLIAQEINENKKPIYGCCVIGKFWDFVVLERKTYYVSKSFDCTERDELMQIIATLRKFREILATTLLDD